MTATFTFRVRFVFADLRVCELGKNMLLGSPLPRSRPLRCNLRDLEKRGESLHSDIVANHMRMQAALESARHELEKGDFTAARKDIEIANEYARRLMKVVGR